MEALNIERLVEEKDNLKTAILYSFIESFPQYEDMTECYEDIRFEEEEIQDWKDCFKEDIKKIEEIERLML